MATMATTSASAAFSGAIPAPSGVIAFPEAFNSPDTLWKWNALCMGLCVGLPGVMFFLRVYVRAWIKRVWIMEDWLACCSFIGLVCYAALTTTTVYHNGGTHEWNVPKEKVPNIAYWVNAVQIEYGPAATFIKTTILCLYLRVFWPGRKSKFAMMIRAFIAVIILFYIGLTMAKILQCIPREKIWHPHVEGKCVSLPVVLIVSGSFNIFSDIAILLVPIKGLWALQMDKRRKLGVYSVFTVGVVGPAFSIIGLVKRLQLVAEADQTYNQPTILLWATAELATGMMIICLPVLPGLLKHHRKRPSASFNNSSSAGGGHLNTNRTNKFLSQPFSTSGGATSDDDENRLVAHHKGAYIELEEGRAASRGRNRDGPLDHSSLGEDSSLDDKPGLNSYATGGRGQSRSSTSPHFQLPLENIFGAAAEQRGQILKTVTVEQSSTTARKG